MGHRDRHVVAHLHHDLAEVAEVLEEAQPPDEVLDAVDLEGPRTHVPVGAAHGREHVGYTLRPITSLWAQQFAG